MHLIRTLTPADGSSPTFQEASAQLARAFTMEVVLERSAELLYARYKPHTTSHETVRVELGQCAAHGSDDKPHLRV